MNRFARGLLAIVLLPALGGCTPSEVPVTPPDPVKLNFIACSDWKDLMQTMTAAYHEKNPGVEISLELYPSEQMMEVIEVKLGSGDSSLDILATGCPEIRGYVNRGYLVPLNKWFSEEDLASWMPKSRDWATVDGKCYAPPMNSSSNLLFYNRDLLDRAGLDDPAENLEGRMTWEELAEQAGAVMERLNPNRDNGIWGMLFEQVDMSYQLLPLANSLGGKGIGDDGYTVEGVLNDSAWIKAMTYYRDLFNTWRIAPKGVAREQSRELFMAGRIAYWVGGPWRMVSLRGQEDMNWGFAPFPYFEGGKIAVPTDSWHLSVSAFSRHPNEAAEFLRWYTVSQEGTELWFRIDGNLPASKSLLQGILDPDAAAYQGEPLAAYQLCAYDEVHHAAPRPRSVGFREWDIEMTKAFQDIRNGADPKESLDEAVERISGDLAKYLK